jgi:hypothetical protein
MVKASDAKRCSDSIAGGAARDSVGNAFTPSRAPRGDSRLRDPLKTSSLHAGDNGDRVGILVKVRFLGDNMNLHQVWDGRLLDRAGLASSDDLEKLFGGRDLARMSDGDAVQWANESQRVARIHAYHFSPAKTLGQDYVQENVPVVEEQLFRAGVFGSRKR